MMASTHAIMATAPYLSVAPIKAMGLPVLGPLLPGLDHPPGATLERSTRTACQKWPSRPR